MTCGQGQRQREVQCRYEDGKASNECDESNKPKSVLDCVLGECPVWREEPWGEVSANTYLQFLTYTLNYNWSLQVIVIGSKLEQEKLNKMSLLSLKDFVN